MNVVLGIKHQVMAIQVVDFSIRYDPVFNAVVRVSNNKVVFPADSFTLKYLNDLVKIWNETEDKLVALSTSGPIAHYSARSCHFSLERMNFVLNSLKSAFGLGGLQSSGPKEIKVEYRTMSPNDLAVVFSDFTCDITGVDGEFVIDMTGNSTAETHKLVNYWNSLSMEDRLDDLSRTLGLYLGKVEDFSCADYVTILDAFIRYRNTKTGTSPNLKKTPKFKTPGSNVYKYKGKFYTIFQESKIKVSGIWESVIIYQTLYNNPDGKYWVRLREEFFSLFKEVELNSKSN